LVETGFVRLTADDGDLRIAVDTKGHGDHFATVATLGHVTIESLGHDDLIG
jgi:hypothetical protein